MNDMKEQYYSDVSIDNQALIFLKEVLPFRIQHQWCFDSKSIALLIIDCQKIFFDQTSHAFIPSAQAILPKIVKLQNYCLKNGIQVIKTQHVNTKENAAMMQRWWGDHLPQNGDPLTEIVSEVIKPGDDPLIKSQYDAFYNSSLDLMLQSRGIKQLIITGVMTHLCCETTARMAFMRGYEVFFTIDGTATYNQQFHLGTLRNLAHGFAIPMLVDEVIDQLQSK